MIVNCFFFLESTSDKEDDGIVRSMCVECRKKLPRDFKAWFYSGKVGPWSLKCNNCNTMIYKHEDQYTEKENPSII